MKVCSNGEVLEFSGSGGSAGEVYSTEETRIGTWIDGKPLYRKVVDVTAPSTMNVWADTAAALPNVKTFFVSAFNMSSMFSDFSIGFRVGNGKLQMYLRTDYRNQRMNVICMYTKTTD